MTGRRSHRSFVSYIDKSREYYAAQGYTRAYEWATHADAPFTPIPRPVAESRVGLVTTAYFPRGLEPVGVPVTPPKLPFAAPVDDAGSCTFTDDLFWAKDETHTDETETYLPVGHVAELVGAGRIGSASARFYGVPTEYSQRRTHEAAADIERWMREDGVDLALLVAL